MNMRLFLFLPLLLLLSLNGSAQKIKGSWYLSLSPTLGNNFNTWTNSPSKQFKDSVNQLDRWRSSIGGSVLYNLETMNKKHLFFGLQYHNVGFTRKRENYKFLDTLHPEIGLMTDLSQTGSNSISFNYRYHYLTVPVLFSTQISGRSLKTATIHWMCGGSVSVLMKHDIRAVLNGFTARGKDVFLLKDEKDDPSRVNVNFQTGFRLENQLYGKNSLIFVQPSLYLPLTSANAGKERHHLYSLSVEVGVILKQTSEKQKL